MVRNSPAVRCPIINKQKRGTRRGAHASSSHNIHVRERKDYKRKLSASKLSHEKDLSTYDIFASCLPGLEPFLNNELKSLGIPQSSSSGGGVHFKLACANKILQCHLHLGTASHIYLRAGVPFRALGMEELCLKVSRQKFWKQYIKIDRVSKTTDLPNLDIKVTSRKSRLFHTKGIAERVERGIWNSLGLDGQAIIDNKISDLKSNHNGVLQKKQATIKILVRISGNMVEISVDTSNTPLHRRGYRLQGGKAPLREDLAFALLYSSGFGPGVSLIDPFCGSGTILIEGAAMACGLPPGRLREVPMLGSQFENRDEWEAMVSSSMDRAYENLERHKKDPNAHKLVGSDRNKGAIHAALGNAERAGVLDLLNLEHQAISSASWFSNPEEAPSRVLVATNPPFGRRVSKDKKGLGTVQSLLPLYQTLGHKVVNLRGNVDFSIFVQDIILARQTAVKNLSLKFASKHGGLNAFVLGAENVALYNQT